MKNVTRNKDTIPPLNPGKLPLRLMKRLLHRYTIQDRSVLIGPSIGIDAAVIQTGKDCIIAKTDPITFVAEDIGFYAININANDIAAMGGRPKWFLATILLPEKETTSSMVERIFSQLSRACKELNISLCGGHTEVTIGIDRPIVIGQMLGEVKKEEIITAAGAKVGDDIILTRGIAIEATSIIGREKEEELKGHFTRRFINRCKACIKSPGLSILKEACIAGRSGSKVHAMHDPTEGGLATGLHELAIASKVGLRIEGKDIPFIPEWRELSRFFNIDPLGAIASGALLMTVHPDYTSQLLRKFKRAQIQASVIGKVTHRNQGIKIVENGKARTLPLFERDEITKIL